MRLVVLWAALIVAEAIHPNWSKELKPETEQFIAVATVLVMIYAIIMDMLKR